MKPSLRRHALILAAAAALTAILLSPLVDSWRLGVEDSPWLFVCAGLVLAGVGAGIRSRWMWAVPGALLTAYAAATLAADDAALALFFMPFAAALLFGVALAGRVIAAVAERLYARGEWAAPVLLGISFVLMSQAILDTWGRRDAPHLTGTAAARLPTDLYTLGQLCPAAETPRRYRADLRLEAQALIAAVERDPDAIITTTSYAAHSDDVFHDEMTVLALLENQYEAIQDHKLEDEVCDAEIERRMREVLDQH